MFKEKVSSKMVKIMVEIAAIVGAFCASVAVFLISLIFIFFVY